MKIIASPGGCSGVSYNMGLDEESKDDVVLTVNGIKILTDESTKEIMENVTVDFDEEQDGFKIDNPDEELSCGGCTGCP